ncbi:hypothetical protein BDQ17DRAFT_1353622 [Cyathus striatus]|nr:hypothetical protein BDQ17DRAFT_1353622 [Cyathus striatus]
MAAQAQAPHDLVAIFHASFHPTKGNVIDWAFKARPDISLDTLEFSALPSGLHLIEQDVVYFTKPPYSGVCIFRRRRCSSPGQRGFKLSSLGVLLEKGTRPRAWKHVAALKELLGRIYEGEDEDGEELARLFFEERKVQDEEIAEGEGMKWEGWSKELDGEEPQDLSNPTLHLPHLLRILGPSTMTLYKHVLARRRILIYTLPPVEAACMLCRVAGDMCFEAQVGSVVDGEDEGEGGGRLKGRAKEPIAVLGMVTLADVDRLGGEGGWIACTTDAIFLEKPSYYDLLIDLTTSTPNRAARPAFYASKYTGGSWRLSTVRFSWSDVKLWTELDRILSLSPPPPSCCSSSTPHTHTHTATASIMNSWTDVWRVYEDVCLLCAGLWMGSWKNGQGGTGGVRLDGEDELQVDEERESGGGVYVRNLGMGIEGVPGPAHDSAVLPSQGHSGPGGKKQRRASSLWSAPGTWGKSKVPREELTEEGVIISLSTPPESAQRLVLTTLALLQTFHAHTCFQVGVLEGLLVREGLIPSSPSSSHHGPTSSSYTIRSRSRSPPKPSANKERILSLTPKDVLSFELGPLSGLDARYLEWMVAEYGDGARMVVKRGWKDWVGLVWYS